MKWFLDLLPVKDQQRKKSGDGLFVCKGIQSMVDLNRREENSCDGAEFLDDRIRMKDQPLCYARQVKYGAAKIGSGHVIKADLW